MKLKERFLASDFHRVFNYKTPESKGRSLILWNCALSNIGSAIISGALYTAFLVENGIDIVRVGIISFIPYLSWMLTLFSPIIMSKFKKRRGVMLFQSSFYYICVVLATTIMPLLVEDAAAKTIWFAVFLFLGNAVNALLGPGASAWQIHFIPEGRDLNVFMHYNNLVSLVLGNATSIISSTVADAVAASGHQFQLLFWLRIGAFVLLMIASYLIYGLPKEYPYLESTQRVQLRQILTEPLRHRPFLQTMGVVAFWNIASCLNSGTFSYYLLETVKLPLLFTYTSAIFVVIGSLFLSKLFRRFLDRLAAYRALAIYMAIFALMDIIYACIAPGRGYLYVGLSVLNGMLMVGFCMAYNTLFYLQLPREANKDLLSASWNLMSNLSSFAGVSLGTWILAIFEARGIWHILGMSLYGSQLLCLLKVVLQALMALYCFRLSKTLRPESSL